MFNFEKLEVWQKAIDFGNLIYLETRRFPSDERFGLTNQLRRAATSVSSNIAEGSSRSSKNEFARFIEIAAGSLFEVVSQSYIARRAVFKQSKLPHHLRRGRGTESDAKRIASIAHYVRITSIG
jgi:four helix bundle protein